MDSSAKYKKIVVITSRFPFPLEKGDKLRAFYQIKELSKHFEVHLISTSEHKVQPKQRDALTPYCKTIHTFPINGIQKLWGAGLKLLGSQPVQIGYFHHYFIHRKIQAILHSIQPDHIYCQLVRAAEYVKNYHICPKTIDYMDALSKGMERRANTAHFLQKYFYRSEYKRLLHYENLIFEYFENKTIISEQDKKLIFHKDKSKIQVVPNGVNPDFLDDTSPVEKSTDIVFIGNMSYSPNILAAQYIVQTLLPQLSTKITVTIAGSSPSREIEKLSAKNVTITGFVSDIKVVYKSAHIFVAPMFIGTGLQNKLLEAMALGVPCITTSLANNALNATPGKEILIADSVSEFVDHINHLIEDPKWAQTIGENGRAFIAKNYNWSNVTLPLIKLINH